MQESFQKMLTGYHHFREKYASGDHSLMRTLSDDGQHPKVMVIACCDSRVDPGLILQCGPGDLFVVRNVANIVPPYEADDSHHGTSAALEFATRFLGVRHLVLFGHSQCGGIQALINSTHGATSRNDSNDSNASNASNASNDFISHWVALVQSACDKHAANDTDTVAKAALHLSYERCFTFPWIKAQVAAGELAIHRWFFDIAHGKILAYSPEKNDYLPLETIF